MKYLALLSVFLALPVMAQEPVVFINDDGQLEWVGLPDEVGGTELGAITVYNPAEFVTLEAEGSVLLDDPCDHLGHWDDQAGVCVLDIRFECGPLERPPTIIRLFIGADLVAEVETDPCPEKP